MKGHPCGREGGVVADTAWRLPRVAERVGLGNKGQALICTDTTRKCGLLRVGTRRRCGPRGREAGDRTRSHLRSPLLHKPLSIHEVNHKERVDGVVEVSA